MRLAGPTAAERHVDAPTRLVVVSVVLAAVLLGAIVSRQPELGIAAAGGLVFCALAVFDLALALAAFTVVQALAGVPGTEGGPSGTLIVIVGVWLVLVVRDPKAFARAWRTSRWPLVAALLFLVWSAASIAWAENLDLAQLMLRQYATALLCLLIVATSVDRVRTLVMLAAGYVAGTVAVIAAAFAYGGNVATTTATSFIPNDGTGRLAIGATDPNYLAAAIVPSVVIALGLMAVKRSAAWRVPLALSLPVLLYGLVETESRGGLVAVAVVAVAAPLLARGRRAAVSGGVVAGMAVLGLFLVLQPGAIDRLSAPEASGGTGRSDVWRIAKQVTLDNPVVGVGVGNFQHVEPRYATDPGSVQYTAFITDAPRVAVDIWLQASTETGLVGVLLLLAAIGGCLVASWRASRLFLAAGMRDLAFLAQMLLVGQLSTVAASTFLSNANDRRFWLLLAFGPALLVVARRVARPRAGAPRDPGPPLALRPPRRRTPLRPVDGGAGDGSRGRSRRDRTARGWTTGPSVVPAGVPGPRVRLAAAPTAAAAPRANGAGPASATAAPSTNGAAPAFAVPTAAPRAPAFAVPATSPRTAAFAVPATSPRTAAFAAPVGAPASAFAGRPAGGTFVPHAHLRGPEPFDDLEPSDATAPQGEPPAGPLSDPARAPTAPGVAPEGSTIGGDMKGGLFWSAASLVLTKLLGFVSILVLAALLAPSQFGTLGAITTFLAFMQLGSDLGMQAAVVYEQEHGISKRIHVAFTLNLALVVVLTILGVALAGPVASFFGAPGQADLFRLGMLNLVLAGLGNVHDGLLLRDLAFAQRIKPRVAQSLIQAVVSIVLALSGFGAVSLVVGLLAGTAAWAAMQWQVTSFRPRLVLDREIARQMLGYGGAAAVLEITAVLAVRADAIVIGHVLGGVALGIYAIAYRLPELAIAQVTWMVSSVAFPALARRRESGLVEATLELCRWLALYTLPIAAALMVLADPIVGTILADKWAAAAPILVAIALSVAFQTVIFPIGDAAKALGNQAGMVAINLVHIPILYAAMLLAADHGLTWVAWAATATSLLHSTMFVVWSRFRAKIPILGVLRAVSGPAGVALGAAAGAGIVRLALVGMPDPLVLVAGMLASAIGGLLALRVFAPDVAEKLVAMDPVGRVRRMRGAHA